MRERYGASDLMHSRGGSLLSAIPFQRLQGVHLDHHPFGFQSTADQVIAGINLSGKRTIVTAASSGIGVETARVLASAGADVTLAVRRLEAGGNVVADITARPITTAYTSQRSISPI